MARKIQRDIPILFIRGSQELGVATGFTDRRIHEKWRNEGLKYSVADNRTFLYKPSDVTAFIERYYAPKNVSVPSK